MRVSGLQRHPDAEEYRAEKEPRKMKFPTIIVLGNLILLMAGNWIDGKKPSLEADIRTAAASSSRYPHIIDRARARKE